MPHYPPRANLSGARWNTTGTWVQRLIRRQSHLPWIHLDSISSALDSFPGSISGSDSNMSASWSPPSEDLSVVSPSSDLITDSSNNTEVSFSSRSRLESAFHAITLAWGWGTTLDTVSCDCMDSGLESDLGARSFLSRSVIDSSSGLGWEQTWVCWLWELQLISQVREDSCAQSSPCHDHQGDEHWIQEWKHWVVKWPHIPPPAICLPTCSSLATQSVTRALDLQTAEQHLAPSSHTISCWPLLFPSTGLALPDEHALTAPGALQFSR